jgi:hypothetical protein
MYQLLRTVKMSYGYRTYLYKMHWYRYLQNSLVPVSPGRGEYRQKFCEKMFCAKRVTKFPYLTAVTLKIFPHV